MRVISIGDLVTDYYYQNGKLLGVNGGMTSHNIVANLTKWKIETSVFGVCGNDAAGLIAIKSLDDLKVDTSNIIKNEDIKTRCFHVSYIKNGDKTSFSSKKRCPICNNKKWYDKSKINTDKIIKDIKNDDILVFDNLNDKNQKIIDSVNNKIMLDLGQYFEFEDLSDKKIIDKLNNKFEIINLNERVEKYLKKRFNIKNEVELYKKISPKLLTITKGKSGAKFIYSGIKYEFTPKYIGEEVDPTGAGDAFFSCIIKEYIKNNMIIDETKFEKWYNASAKLTSKVVEKMGARGHLHSLYKIKIKSDCCHCDTFDFVERKKIKRCNININNLEKRINNALDSKAYPQLKKIGFNENDNYIFTGTGGSLAGAKFASNTINYIYGSNTYALTPREVVYRNNKNINKILLFSYSGTTNDVLESAKGFDKDSIIITKGNQKKVSEKTGYKQKNIISYATANNKGKERGFLSFEGAVVPATLFLKYYIEMKKLNINIKEFIHSSIEYWNEYFEEYFSNNDIKKIFSNTINIFTGDYTNCACIDTESKLIESGIYNCLVHEKKNFSHGRFINYENLKNKSSIYFKQKTTSKYEKKLLNYLDKGENLIVESKYNDILCEYDLLIASQYIIYYIGKYLDIDVSKPKYSEDSMKIYFYKGKLD